MSLLEILPLLAAAGFLTFVGLLARRDPQTPVHWSPPAALSLALLIWSLEAVITEGPIGFWPMISQSLWGNQVWFDLLLAFGIGLSFLVPQAREQGMRVLPWMALVCFLSSSSCCSLPLRAST